MKIDKRNNRTYKEPNSELTNSKDPENIVSSCCLFHRTQVIDVQMYFFALHKDRFSTRCDYRFHSTYNTRIFSTTRLRLQHTVIIQVFIGYSEPNQASNCSEKCSEMIQSTLIKDSEGFLLTLKNSAFTTCM